MKRAALCVLTAAFGLVTGCGIIDPTVAPTGCFVADTQVATPNGEVAIQTIAVGDSVLAFRPEDGAVVVRKVLATFRGPARSIRELDVGGIAIETTDEHPFWDAERRTWTRAGALAEGTVLVGLRDDGGTRPLSLASSRSRADDVEVFNLTVEGPEHTFFANGVAVHNKSIACEPPQCEEPAPAPAFDAPLLTNADASETTIVFRRFGPEVTIDRRLVESPLSTALLDPDFRESHALAPGASVILPVGKTRTWNTSTGDAGVVDAIVVEIAGRPTAIFGRGPVSIEGSRLAAGQPQAVQVVPFDAPLAACTTSASLPLSFDSLPGAFEVEYEVKALAWNSGCVTANLDVWEKGALRSPVVYEACLPIEAWPFAQGQRFYVHPTSTPKRQELVQTQPTVVSLALWRVDAAVVGNDLPGGAGLDAFPDAAPTCGTTSACGTVTGRLPWHVVRRSGTHPEEPIFPGGKPTTYPSGAATTTLWLVDAAYTPVLGSGCATKPPAPITFGIAAISRVR